MSARYDLATEPLRPHDAEDVTEAGGVRIGDRVRATEDLLVRWRVAGLCDVSIDSARAGGTVVRIIRSVAGWWTTVVVRMGVPAVYADGSGGALHEPFGPEDLEVLVADRPA